MAATESAPEISAALLRHYDGTRRAMPWRETSDPYAIWVSEVMLQQTRVDTVVPYFQRWLDRFPTVEALAAADRDAVLLEWQGLGYYSRARNLHRAARVVRERHGGRVPDDAAALRELPGVGEYTAGAVASIAFGVRVPAVDGNVRRVLARLYDLEEPTAAELRGLADSLVPDHRPGDHNQALMELGATICTPRSPACDRCPVASWCRARRLGVQEERPVRRRGKVLPEEVVTTHVVVRSDGAMLLVRRPEEGLLGGMWAFPGDDASGPAAVTAAIEAAEPVRSLEPVRHVFSHKRVTYEPRLSRLAGRADADGGGEPGGERGRSAAGPAVAGDAAWVRPARLEGYALPVAQQRIAERALAALAGAAEPVVSGAADPRGAG